MKKRVSRVGFQRRADWSWTGHCSANERRTASGWLFWSLSRTVHVFPNYSSPVELPADMQTLLPHCRAHLMLYSFCLIYLYCAYFSQCSDVNVIQIQYLRQIQEPRTVLMKANTSTVWKDEPCVIHYGSISGGKWRFQRSSKNKDILPLYTLRGCDRVGSPIQSST